MEQDYRPSKDLRDSTVIISSTTTSAGAVDGTTLIDTVLTQANDYWNNMAVVILSGNSIGQVRRISDFTAASDTILVDTAFASQIASGTKYNIVAQHSPAPSSADATAANQVLILADVGDASTATLGSLYGIVGNPAAGQDLSTRIGYEGATSLADKLTAARATLLDNLDAAITTRSTLTQANILSDATPFAGANVANLDTTISSRSTLTQANILSDVTPFAGADIATIKADSQTIEDATLKASPTAGSLARFVASGGTALGTQLPDSKSLYDCLSGGVSAANTVVGKRQVFEKSITAAANVGVAQTIGTVATQACIIESIIVYADAAQTTDLTTCAVTGASGSVTFIPTSVATQANLAAADNQVSTGIISVRLAVGKTIVITPLGTGATALDLTVVVTYYSSSANGGTIS